MIAFIEEPREACGAELICRILPIASSTYYAHATVAREPGKASDRFKRVGDILTTIKRIHN